MINKVVLVGRITKDPELRFVSVDIPMVRFALAVNRTYTNKNGIKETDFINCIVWRKQAENLTKYITKGSLLGIEGSIRTSSYENEEGIKKYVTEVACDSIQFLESKKNNNILVDDKNEESKHNIDKFTDDMKNFHEEDNGLPF